MRTMVVLGSAALGLGFLTLFAGCTGESPIVGREPSGGAGADAGVEPSTGGTGVAAGAGGAGASTGGGGGGFAQAGQGNDVGNGGSATEPGRAEPDPEA